MQLKNFLMQQKKLIQSLNRLTENKIFYYLLIVLTSISFTIYYGYRGVFPIDSFLIFNSGYNVLNNFHPFKDYWSITGPLLDYIQYLFFFIFEINWLSYVMHAAFINTILATFIFYFYNKIKLKKNLGLIYVIGISILAYPITGTPFMDLHSVIFSLISLCCFIIGLNSERKKYWFLSSFFIVLSFFSKQIPSAYLFILLLVSGIFYKIYFKEKKTLNDLICFFLGGIVGVFLFLLILLFNEISINNFLVQYIYYPISLGESRLDRLNLNFNNTISQFKFIYFALIPIVIVSFILFKRKNSSIKIKKDLFLLLLVFLSSLIFIYGQLMTKNQILIFFLVPFYLGIGHLFANKYFKNKYLIFFIIIIFSISLTKFHIRFNHNKKFMEFSNIDFNIAVNAKEIDYKLSNLNWITPEYPTSPKKEISYLNEAKNIITKDLKPKILVTDYQFLQAIIPNNRVSPNKWYDDLSVPRKDNKFFKHYKRFFLNKIKSQKIENIYIVGLEKENYIKFFFNNCLNEKKLSDIVIRLNLSECKF